MKRTKSKKIDDVFKRLKAQPKLKIKQLEGVPPGLQPDTRVYVTNQLGIYVSSMYGWHVSVSHPARYPTWDELADIRYQLVPDNVYMAMILPPSAAYINLHPNCFQMNQVTAGHKYRPEQWERLYGPEQRVIGDMLKAMGSALRVLSNLDKCDDPQWRFHAQSALEALQSAYYPGGEDEQVEKASEKESTDDPGGSVGDDVGDGAHNGSALGDPGLP